MGLTRTLGGDRLGGGKKQKVHMHGYERTNHDLSYVWKSTMACGTLVPFMVEVALPGDTFDIDLHTDVLTHPTIGPLFGSFKVHTDVFQVPIRLYQAALHMNMLDIGMDMSKILLPRVKINAVQPDIAQPIDNQQINPSSIFKYLGISGLGKTLDPSGFATRFFNAIPYLAYWDIYKNYYSNKQEKIGAVIHTSPTPVTGTLSAAQLYKANPLGVAIPVGATPAAVTQYDANNESYLVLQFSAGGGADLQMSQIVIQETTVAPIKTRTADQLWNEMYIVPGSTTTILKKPKYNNLSIAKISISAAMPVNISPKITTFPLANIDTMRTKLLAKSIATPYDILVGEVSPYSLPLQFAGSPTLYSINFTQEGLGLRTFASDLFNNWVNTDTIDGANGITAVTSVNVVGNKFTLDELNLNKKVYEMLNRIAVSGGTYDDWLEAVYDHQRMKSSENPMYIGGQLRNVVFQEVVSNAATETEPLGTLAGRGKIGGMDKGGRIIAKIDEPSYLIGIVSLVPNLDYTQGNRWDVNLATMNDFHKPALDAIGFQNLITEQMAWWESTIPVGNGTPTYRSAGKQPAWINYTTNVSRAYGNFAEEEEQMFMILARNYDVKAVGADLRINDLTTYIDPSKFNNIFADVRLDAQNFWVQIAVDITARRKMSGKVIPNL